MFDQEREDAMARGEDYKDKAKCPECRVSLRVSNKVNDRVRWTRDVWFHLNLSRPHIVVRSRRMMWTVMMEVQVRRKKTMNGSLQKIVNAKGRVKNQQRRNLAKRSNLSRTKIWRIGNLPPRSTNYVRFSKLFVPTIPPTRSLSFLRYSPL
jgi:hypothetical protein